MEAHVLDPQGVSAAVVEYQTMAPGEYIRRTDPEFETEWTPVPMAYSGETGKFAAPIPPLPHRTLVRYRIVAADGATPTR